MRARTFMLLAVGTLLGAVVLGGAGMAVAWTNQDTAPHTVTFKIGMKDSGLLQKGQRFSYTFATAGTYDYYCTVHPSMTAIVTVTA